MEVMSRKISGADGRSLPLSEDKTPVPGGLLVTLTKGLSNSLKVKLLFNITIC